ncbi:hypothetical protein HUU39_25080 [candidate division KSB1 bacterium]|nr:hypothetical protein [candidate division KSB1 bacterium]
MHVIGRLAVRKAGQITCAYRNFAAKVVFVPQTFLLAVWMWLLVHQRKALWESSRYLSMQSRAANDFEARRKAWFEIDHWRQSVMAL